jgi:hypothetical protein
MAIGDRYTLTGLSSFCMIMMVLSGETAPAVGALNSATRTFGAAGLEALFVDAAPGISPLRSFKKSQRELPAGQNHWVGNSKGARLSRARPQEPSALRSTFSG